MSPDIEYSFVFSSPEWLFHHDGSAPAWLIAIEEECQGHHQDGSEGEYVVDIDIGQGLRLRLKLLI
jgi:hypothetical protein